MERGGGLPTCGVSASGGRSGGFCLAAPGAGLTSIGGGSGATCGWPATGAGGALIVVSHDEAFLRAIGVSREIVL